MSGGMAPKRAGAKPKAAVKAKAKAQAKAKLQGRYQKGGEDNPFTDVGIWMVPAEKPYVTQKEFQKALKEWARKLDAGHPISVRTQVLYNTISVWKRSFWCSSCKACLKWRGWRGQATYSKDTAC